MGVDQNITLGPYVECRYTPIEIDAITSKYVCVKQTDHKPVSGSQFCHQCGASVELRTLKTGKKISSSIDTWKISTELQERMYCASSMSGPFGEPNTDYWLANVSWDKSKRRTILGKYQEAAIPISPELMAAETQTFSTFFAKDLEILCQHYKSVVVRWGLISYCS